VPPDHQRELGLTARARALTLPDAAGSQMLAGRLDARRFAGLVYIPLHPESRPCPSPGVAGQLPATGCGPGCHSQQTSRFAGASQPSTGARSVARLAQAQRAWRFGCGSSLRPF
jgi:hypothetical protein